MKCIFPYSGHACSNINGGQSRAVLKGVSSYSRHGVGDDDRGQPRTTPEGLLANDGDGIGDAFVFYTVGDNEVARGTDGVEGGIDALAGHLRLRTEKIVVEDLPCRRHRREVIRQKKLRMQKKKHDGDDSALYRKNLLIMYGPSSFHAIVEQKIVYAFSMRMRVG